MSASTLEIIEQTIEEMINPALEMHDGSIELISTDLDSITPEIKISFKGGCVGCAATETTTLMGIMMALREETGIANLIVKNILLENEE